MVDRALFVGSEVPDFVLPTLVGTQNKLSDFRGNRMVLFMWISWRACRDQLSVWQKLCSQYKPQGIEVVSTAIDVQGSEKVRPYLETAGATFVTFIDQTNLLSTFWLYSRTKWLAY